MKKSSLVLALALNMTMVMSPSAHAFDFKGLVDKAVVGFNEQAEVAKKKIAEMELQKQLSTAMNQIQESAKFPTLQAEVKKQTQKIQTSNDDVVDDTPAPVQKSYPQNAPVARQQVFPQYRYVAPESQAPSITQVDNSKVKIAANVPMETQSIWIKVIKNGRAESLFLPASNGSFSKTAYLRQGTGIYDIEIYRSADKNAKSFYLLQKTQVENVDSRDMEGLLPSDDVQSDNEEIIALAQSITAGAKSELEKAKKIHLYVAQTISYDFPGYDAEVAKSRTNNEEEKAKYTALSYLNKKTDALSVLRAKESVCAGYANLNAALLRAVGIRANVVYGTAYIIIAKQQTVAAHGWNEIFVNGEWRSVDVTWDSTTKVDFKYFNMSQEKFDVEHVKNEVMLL